MAHALTALAAALVLAQLLPFAITPVLILTLPTEHGLKPSVPERAVCLAAGAVCDLLALVIADAAHFHTIHIIEKLLSVLSLGCTAQEVASVATSDAVAACAAVLIGVIGRFFLSSLRLRYTHGLDTGFADEGDLYLIEALRISLFDPYYRDSWLRLTAVGRRVLLLSCAFFASLLLLAHGTAYHSLESLRIAGVCRRTTEAAGTDAERDESRVIVRNDGPLDCTARLLYLTDDENDPTAYPFADVSVPAGGTATLAMDYDRGVDLSPGGGSTVWLMNGAGVALDSVTLPALGEDELYVLRADADGSGEAWEIVTLSSDGDAAVPAPVFSRDSGFYGSEFRLSLSANPGLTIHYTLDCSTPTADSALYADGIRVYDRSAEPDRYRSIENVTPDYLSAEADDGTENDPVMKAFVVRAVAVDADGRTSDVVTKTYFIGLDALREATVVSLVADPYDLFDDEYGIYVTGADYDAYYERVLAGETVRVGDIPLPNYEQSGIEWEREANFELFRNGSRYINQLAGIRIQGHGSRASHRKRFSIFAREEYSGSRYFDEPIFDDGQAHSLVLRAGAMNAFAQLIAEGRDVLSIPFTRAAVFLDGEYWYNTYLYEKAAEHLFTNLYGVSEDNVAIVKNGDVTDDALEGGNPYSAIYEFLARNDLSDDTAYAQFNDIVDIQSFIDASCIQIYMADVDYQEQWNNYLWHTVVAEDDAYGDTRWRWGLYDLDLNWASLDAAFTVENPWEINPFTMYGVYQLSPITEWPIYAALRTNGTFCRSFVTTFMDIVNTRFRADTYRPLLDRLDSSAEAYAEFLENRADCIVPYVAEEFGLSGTLGTVTLTVSDPDGGTVTLNTVTPEPDGSPWSGEYFTDYPVTVTANANPGYTFAGWEINGRPVSGSTVEVSFGQGGVTIHAIFNSQ